jgi:hypothetical protein
VVNCFDQRESNETDCWLHPSIWHDGTSGRVALSNVTNTSSTQFHTRVASRYRNGGAFTSDTFCLPHKLHLLQREAVAEGNVSVAGAVCLEWNTLRLLKEKTSRLPSDWTVGRIRTALLCEGRRTGTMPVNYEGNIVAASIWNGLWTTNEVTKCCCVPVEPSAGYKHCIPVQCLLLSIVNGPIK